MRWLPSRLGAAGLSLLSVLAGCAPNRGGSSGGPYNSCVDCHRAAVARGGRRHGYADWLRSPHARAGVTCEGCHGGNPASRGRPAAHLGVLPASRPESLVHPSRASETCGDCHARELRAFSRSGHLPELRRSGRGPGCPACHGSLGERRIRPGEMESLCASCHGGLFPARAALEALRRALAPRAGRPRRIRRAFVAGHALGPEAWGAVSGEPFAPGRP